MTYQHRQLSSGKVSFRTDHEVFEGVRAVGVFLHNNVRLYSQVLFDKAPLVRPTEERKESFLQ